MLAVWVYDRGMSDGNANPISDERICINVRAPINPTVMIQKYFCIVLLLI